MNVLVRKDIDVNDLVYISLRKAEEQHSHCCFLFHSYTIGSSIMSNELTLILWYE